MKTPESLDQGFGSQPPDNKQLLVKDMSLR